MDEVSQPNRSFLVVSTFAQNNTTARGSTDWCACTQDRGGLTLDQVREYIARPSLPVLLKLTTRHSQRLQLRPRHGRECIGAAVAV